MAADPTRNRGSSSDRRPGRGEPVAVPEVDERGVREGGVAGQPQRKRQVDEHRDADPEATDPLGA
ncbi:MAG: hypothetical protein WD354_05070, partial [Acidimicrobiia bacterium]